MKKCIFFLILISFIIYNLNFSLFRTPYSSAHGDTTTNRMLPFNLFSGKGIFFDDFYNMIHKVDPVLPYFLQKVDSHYLPSFPILPGIMAAPFYWPVYLVMKLKHLNIFENFYSYSMILEKIAASFYSSLNVGLFFVLMYFLSKNKKISFIFALIFAFATHQFSINSQALWQTTFISLFMIIGQILMIKGQRAEDKFKKRYFIFGLLISYLTIWTRYNFLIYYFIYLITLLMIDKKNKKIYWSIFIISTLANFFFNIYFYHSLLGGFEPFVSEFPLNNLGDYINHLLAIFFSPGKGILFYSPFYFFGFFSYLYLKKIRKEKEGDNLWYLNMVHIVSVILLIAAKIDWYGGQSWASRYISDIIVSLIILVYYFYRYNKNRLIKYLFFALVTYSIFTEVVGTFCYPKAAWDYYPSNETGVIDKRIWSFTDNLLQRNLASGPEASGYKNFMNWLIEGKIDNEYYLGKERSCRLIKVAEKKYLGYKIISLNLTNTSNVDWITTTFQGPNIILKQVFIDEKILRVEESPIPALNLPRVIKKGKTVRVEILALPPSTNKDIVTIFPAQDYVGNWNEFCEVKLEI